MKIQNFLYFIFFLVFIFWHNSLVAQNINDSSTPKIPDTQKVIIGKKTVSPIKKNSNDTLNAQKKHNSNSVADSLKRKRNIAIANQSLMVHKKAIKDSLEQNKKSDTITISAITSIKSSPFNIDKLLLKNRFINVKSTPVFLIEKEHHPTGKEFLFYSLCIIGLILGLFKTFYGGYFNNLFRVYFNTSLRQTQLADQLLQAKLPSFILNIFFALSVGMYIWLLFGLYHPPRLISSKLLLPFCILSVALLYFVKFCLLKFMGWVADISHATDHYIFAIFLVNKITGILLIPIIILLAFLKREWQPIIAYISFMALALFFISRYVKSYGAIERKMPLNYFHFIIYILGGEIIPLLIIYKVAIDYLI
ncbi:MAG TPA: DUF4271 domain-containing protein [Hanamia sp.]|nr:DUF4271 domain-containing protein [Hanamia sp.]